MSSLSNIKDDLRNALSHIDVGDYVLNSMINHLEEQCSEVEIKVIEDMCFDLEKKEYETKEEFIEDYQPIFDTVDFPIKAVFRILDKRQLNWDEI